MEGPFKANNVPSESFPQTIRHAGVNIAPILPRKFANAEQKFRGVQRKAPATERGYLPPPRTPQSAPDWDYL
jgi:hypothetical protein